MNGLVGLHLSSEEGLVFVLCIYLTAEFCVDRELIKDILCAVECYSLC